MREKIISETWITKILLDNIFFINIGMQSENVFVKLFESWKLFCFTCKAINFRVRRQRSTFFQIKVADSKSR